MSRLTFYSQPNDQLIAGIFFLVAGLLIFPFAAAKLAQVVQWMNAGMGFSGAWYVKGMAIIRWGLATACAFFAIVGAFQLAIYAVHKAGLVKVC